MLVCGDVAQTTWLGVMALRGDRPLLCMLPVTTTECDGMDWRGNVVSTAPARLSPSSSTPDIQVTSSSPTATVSSRRAPTPTSTTSHNGSASSLAGREGSREGGSGLGRRTSQIRRDVSTCLLCFQLCEYFLHSYKSSKRSSHRQQWQG